MRCNAADPFDTPAVWLGEDVHHTRAILDDDVWLLRKPLSQDVLKSWTGEREAGQAEVALGYRPAIG